MLGTSTAVAHATQQAVLLAQMDKTSLAVRSPSPSKQNNCREESHKHPKRDKGVAAAEMSNGQEEACEGACC